MPDANFTVSPADRSPSVLGLIEDMFLAEMLDYVRDVLAAGGVSQVFSSIHVPSEHNPKMGERSKVHSRSYKTTSTDLTAVELFTDLRQALAEGDYRAAYLGWLSLKRITNS